MKKPVVAITIGKMHYPRMFSQQAWDALAAFAEVIHHDQEEPAQKDDLITLLAGADACITSWEVAQLDADVMAAAGVGFGFVEGPERHEGRLDRIPGRVGYHHLELGDGDAPGRGELVHDPLELRLQADGKEVLVPEDQHWPHEHGVVEALVAGSSTPTNLGTLQLADFINPTGLEPIGENLFKESVASGTPTTGSPAATGLGTLSQGFLETSNVNVVEELVNMIEAQRAYEMNSKAISTTDDMLQFASQQL